MSIEDCKARLPLPELWGRLFPEIPFTPRKHMRAGWREERTGSLTAKQEGSAWVWYDHGSKVGGDEVRLIMLGRACDFLEAARLYHEWANVPWVEAKARSGKPGKKEDLRFVCAYDYLDESGALKHQTLRFLKLDAEGHPIAKGDGGFEKTFLQRRPAAEGLSAGTKHAKYDKRTGQWWLWTLDGIEPVLYHLPELLARPADEVWLVEGEKDADALAARGLLATTAPMGSGKWRPAYSLALQGRAVVICGDSDAAGRKHIETVGPLLKAAGCKVRSVDWSAALGGEVIGKWDAAKFLEEKEAA